MFSIKQLAYRIITRTSYLNCTISIKQLAYRISNYLARLAHRNRLAAQRRALRGRRP